MNDDSQAWRGVTLQWQIVRILRLYVGSESPSLNLKTLATYIVKVYAPMWFFIKSSSSCKDGARHLWRSIELSRYLDEKVRDVVDAEMAFSATLKIFFFRCYLTKY